MLITAHLNKTEKNKNKRVQNKKYFTDEIFIPKADILRRKCCKQKFIKKIDDEDNKSVCV